MITHPASCYRTEQLAVTRICKCILPKIMPIQQCSECSTSLLAYILTSTNMAKKNWIPFIEENITECNISYRGGVMKVDVSSLFPNVEDAVMGAHQNYLGGGIAGAIVGAAMFDPSELSQKDQKIFMSLKDAIKHYFYNVNNGGGDEYMQENVNAYEQNQSLPVSGY